MEERHTSTHEMRCFFHAQRGGVHVLHLPSEFGVFRVVVHHVAGAAATGGEDILFDGGRDEVFGSGAGFLGAREDVA